MRPKRKCEFCGVERKVNIGDTVCHDCYADLNKADEEFKAAQAATLRSYKKCNAPTHNYYSCKQCQKRSEWPEEDKEWDGFALDTKNLSSREFRAHKVKDGAEFFGLPGGRK